MIGLGKLGCMGKMGNVTSGGLMLPEVQASGRAFPIWNTVVGTDKLLSLSIHGLTEQNGTPTPEVPVPIQSVGDSGLLLSIMQDKTGGDYQLLDIGGAMRKAGYDGMLRSAGTVYDEIKYNGAEWTFQKRIHTNKVVRTSVNANSYVLNDSYAEMWFYNFPSDNGQYRPYSLCNCLTNSNAQGTFTANSFSTLGSRIYVRLPITYDTADKFLDWIDANEVIVTYAISNVEIPAPVTLDLPAISTYDNQTYFATNAAVIKPYMEATAEVSKAIQPIKGGLVWWFELSPSDWNNNKILNKVNENEYLEPKNFSGTPESGTYDNYTQFDGIDDYMVINSGNPVKSYQLLISDPITLADRNHWILSDDVTSGFNYNQLNWIFNPNEQNTAWYENNSPVQRVGLIKDIQDRKRYLFGLSNGDINKSFTTIGTYQSDKSFCAKFKGYALFGYDKEINQDTINNNLRYCRQRFGENFDGYTI